MVVEKSAASKLIGLLVNRIRAFPPHVDRISCSDVRDTEGEEGGGAKGQIAFVRILRRDSTAYR